VAGVGGGGRDGDDAGDAQTNDALLSSCSREQITSYDVRLENYASRFLVFPHFAETKVEVKVGGISGSHGEYKDGCLLGCCAV
jgi:hypothetical protein